MGKLSKAIRASLEALPVEGVEPLNLDAPADELDNVSEAMLETDEVVSSLEALRLKLEAVPREHRVPAVTALYDQACKDRLTSVGLEGLNVSAEGFADRAWDLLKAFIAMLGRLIDLARQFFTHSQGNIRTLEARVRELSTVAKNAKTAPKSVDRAGLYNALSIRGLMSPITTNNGLVLDLTTKALGSQSFMVGLADSFASVTSRAGGVNSAGFFTELTRAAVPQWNGRLTEVSDASKVFPNKTGKMWITDALPGNRVLGFLGNRQNPATIDPSDPGAEVRNFIEQLGESIPVLGINVAFNKATQTVLPPVDAGAIGRYQSDLNGILRMLKGGNSVVNRLDSCKRDLENLYKSRKDPAVADAVKRIGTILSSHVITTTRDIMTYGINYVDHTLTYIEHSLS